MLRQIKSCCDVFCMPRGLGIYRQHDDDKKKKKKHRTPEEEWLSGCVTIPGSGNSNMTIFEVTYSTEGTCDIPLKCREQIIHCFRSTSIDNSKSIPVQNTIDQNGTVEVDLHSEPIDLELSWYMPPSKNIHVGIGHLFSYAPLSETGCKDLRECQTERDFIPIDGLDFLEVTEMVNSTLRRRAYQEEGIQLASARGKITIYFNGWTYHLQGYDAYVILWGKKVEPYRKKILTHLPVIMGLRNDQLHYNTPTSSPPKRKKYKEEEEEEEEMKQATPPCRTGTDMDLVCLREDVPQVHEWLSCPKLGSVKVFDAPQQSATFWDVLMKEMVVK